MDGCQAHLSHFRRCYIQTLRTLFWMNEIEIHHEFLMGEKGHLTVKLLLATLCCSPNSQDIQMSLVQNMRNGPKILSRCTLHTLLHNSLKMSEKYVILL